MGMSASQARLIQLEARQSNLEYQGQQINQERTILSQQCTALYNSLLSMTVPTPPSTQDFTSVQYTGKSGATTYSFNATNVKPGKDGLYNVTIGYSDYGHSLTRNNGYAVTSTGYETVKGTKFSASDTQPSTTTRTISGFNHNTEGNPEEPPREFLVPQSSKPSSGTYYVADGHEHLVLGGKGYTDEESISTYYVVSTDPTKWNKDTCIDITNENNKTQVSISTTEPAKITLKESELDALYTIDENGNIEKAVAGEDYITDAAGNVTLIGTGEFFLVKDTGSDIGKRGSSDGVKIGGYAAMTMEEYKAMFDEKTMDIYNGYCEAIANSGLVDGSGNPYGPEDFYVYLDGNNKPHFALKTDVMDNDTCVTYDYLANGEYTHNVEHDGSKLTFDPATGRITSIDLPVKDSDGNVISWTSVELEAKTVTDELAYQDAYNDYEYEQYLYDKKQQEINAKTEIIQQEDRNLELKLQRLDNERTQITTEIEAVEKVIQDNIEASYKTFSG